jgi:putative heme-binding domain-containing protein
VKEYILKRLMQRYILAGGTENYRIATRLMELAPGRDEGKILVSGVQEGLRGRDAINLSPELARAIQPYQSELFGGPLALAIRQGNTVAVKEALGIIADENANFQHRLSYIKIMGQSNQPESVPVLLKIIESAKPSGALKQTALQALQRYNVDEIGRRVVLAYPQFRADGGVRSAALDLLASRVKWTLELLNAIEKTKKISKTDVPEALARRLKLLNDPAIERSVDNFWPNVKLATSTEKNEAISKYAKLISSGTADVNKGRVLYLSNCGSCHRLFNEGGLIGPDLTGYERSNVNYFLLNIVDPNADIREGYVIHRVTTTDGRTLEGKIAASNGDVLTLQSLSGEETTLAAAQIKEMKALQTSIMPERILDPLSDQEIRDIFAYIMKKN